MVFALLLSRYAVAPAQEPGGHDVRQDAEREWFETKVRPLLSTHCISCHSAEAAKGGIRLDDPEMLGAGDSEEPVVLPGDPDGSRLIQVVRYTADVKMPPAGPIPAAAVRTLEEWVNRGAFAPTSDRPGAVDGSAPKALDPELARRAHWAFRPLAPVDPPNGAGPFRSAHPIDLFVAAKLREAGLSSAPEAPRATLIRRLTFDLIGLPPTPEEVQAFVEDGRPDAYERLVERLLASPRYGERWARHWLDLARYADTQGGDKGGERLPYAYTYRDWVVNALNADMPYGEFLVKQLAADQMGPEADLADLAALGFLTVHRDHGDVEPDRIDDRIDVLMRTTQGLTVACARCHDHKYDPIPTADYYALYGVFAGSTIREVPLAATEAERQALARFERGLTSRRWRLVNYVEGQRRKLHGGFRSARNLAAYWLAAQHELTAGSPEPERPRAGRPRPRRDGLSPELVTRWRDKLRETQAEHHAFFAPWHAFAALEPERFVAAAPGLARAFARNADEEHPIHPAVARLFASAPPRSLAEVARRYGELLARVDQAWRRRVREAYEAGQDPPPALDDPAEEDLRQMLYGDGSPTELSLDNIRDMLQNRGATDALEQLDALRESIDAWRNGPEAPPHAMALVDPAQPVTPTVFVRGNPERPGPEVPRRFLAVLSSTDRAPFEHGSGRLDLARAVTDAANPLTARVMVNRVWQHHFGRGLVRTPSDFGSRGEPPTHPELLDWLAARFLAEGQSMKALHRLIVTSATYRQASQRTDESNRQDPENRWLGRFERRRLEVEPFRDAVLAVSGVLDGAQGGPAVEAESTRRTLYTRIDRADLDPVLVAFDMANPDLHCAERSSSVVPQQSLFLLNSPFVVEHARALAARLDAEAGPDTTAWIARAYRTLYARGPSEEELTLGQRFLARRDVVAPQPDPLRKQAWQAPADGSAEPEDDASEPPDPPTAPLSFRERYVQVLMMASEFQFID
jgi:hypothetical protein